MNNEAVNLKRRQFLRWAGSAGVIVGAAPLALAEPLSRAARFAAAAVPRHTSFIQEAAFAGTTPVGGEALLRLNANENPFGASPAARKAIERAITDANRYPIAERETLIDALSKKHGVKREQVLPGAGSTELIRVAVSTLAASGHMLMAEPTYEDPVEYSHPFDVKIIRVPLDRDGVHDLQAMERALTKKTRLIYICNPNNPTGTVLGAEALESFVRRVSKRATVLVDEAYHEYVSDPHYASMLPLVVEGLPVIITRTFSKIHGLAGLRLGYAVADKKLLERLAARLTFAGANMVAIHAALASLKDHGFLEHCYRQNELARDYMRRALTERGYRVFPSQTNFVMFHLGSEVRELISALKQRGIHVGRPFPPYTKYCRVSLGTLEQMERLVAELDLWRQAAAA